MRGAAGSASHRHDGDMGLNRRDVKTVAARRRRRSRCGGRAGFRAPSAPARRAPRSAASIAGRRRQPPRSPRGWRAPRAAAGAAPRRRAPAAAFAGLPVRASRRLSDRPRRGRTISRWPSRVQPSTCGLCRIARERRRHRLRAPARADPRRSSPTKSMTIGPADIAQPHLPRDQRRRRPVGRQRGALGGAGLRRPGIDIDQRRRPRLLDVDAAAAAQRNARRQRRLERGIEVERPIVAGSCPISAPGKAPRNSARIAVSSVDDALRRGRQPQRQRGREAGRGNRAAPAGRAAPRVRRGQGGRPRRSCRSDSGALSAHASRRTCTSSRAPSSSVAPPAARAAAAEPGRSSPISTSAASSAGYEPHHPAEMDAARRPGVAALDIKLDRLAVLDPGGAPFAGPGGDQQLAGMAADSRGRRAAAPSRTAAGRRRWNRSPTSTTRTPRRGPGSHSRRPCRAIRRSRDRRRSRLSVSRLNATWLTTAASPSCPSGPIAATPP